MGYKRRGLVLVLLIFVFSVFSSGHAQDYELPYFLAKASAKEGELSKKERAELCNRVEEMMERAERIRRNLVKSIQTGETDINYQDGRFWMSKLERDRESIETGLQQVKLLKEKAALVPSVKVYKAMRDLSEHLNAYNNVVAFSGWVGDLAPELELWADPVFYQLCLLPLAQSKDVEKKPPPKEKEKPTAKGKKP